MTQDTYIAAIAKFIEKNECGNDDDCFQVTGRMVAIRLD